MERPAASLIVPRIGCGYEQTHDKNSSGARSLKWTLPLVTRIALMSTTQRRYFNILYMTVLG
jgi:hypothetical protein